jgi:carbon-monoxide dehydrogenase large subunit
LGATLYESIIYSETGKVRNDHFTDYKIPTPEDLWKTEFETIFVETPEEGGPYGARSLGEHAIVSIPAVVANAISNATGIEFFELPITAEKMLKKLKEQGK